MQKMSQILYAPMIATVGTIAIGTANTHRVVKMMELMSADGLDVVLYLRYHAILRY